MREPDLFTDGWALESGEERHRNAPETFWIPERSEREALKRGDYAKLIFQISVEDEEAPIVERMWVVVRGKLESTYFGLLDNQPDSIEANDDFWLGSEVPFRAEHVIDIQPADEESIDFAGREPRRPWPRD